MKKQKRQLVGTVNHPPVNKYQPKVPCGARTRSGTLCQKPAMPGKARCKLHGGASTGPKVPADQTFNQKAAKAALWSKIVFAHEEDWVKLIRSEDGGMTLMTELEILRIQFLRAAVAQKKWLAFRDKLTEGTAALIDTQMQELGVFDQYELHHHSGVKLLEWMTKNTKEGEDPAIPFEDWKVVKRQRDYAYEMRQFAKAIDRLMRTQMELSGLGADEDAVTRIAEDLQAFYTNAAALMPGGDPDGAAQEDDDG